MKKTEEVEDARTVLAERLNIPLTKLNNPKVRDLFDAHFAKVRKIVTEPLPLPPLTPNLYHDSSVGACRSANRNRKADPYEKSR